MSGLRFKKISGICINKQTVTQGNPIMIPASAVDERVKGLEKAGQIILVKKGDSYKVVMQ